MEEAIQRLREKERLAVQDAKQLNNIVDILKVVNSVDQSKDLRIAAIHCLRRIFLELLDSERLKKPKVQSSSKNSGLDKVSSWLWTQYEKYHGTLYSIISTADMEWGHALSIRTIMEFVKLEHRAFQSAGQQLAQNSHSFALLTFRSMLDALILCNNEIDADLLIMLRGEVFEWQDCLYFGLAHILQLIITLKDDIKQGKLEPFLLTTRTQNLLDILRVVSVPLELSRDKFWAPFSDKHDEESSDSSEGEDSDEEDTTHLTVAKNNKKRKGQLPETGAANKRPRKERTPKLMSIEAYQKIFSKAWLAFLSLPLDQNQHKTILKHLSDHVVPYLINPLLLADYLTQSYKIGGVIAVLALESLFQLIVKNNLDYPNFFVSLYGLCKVNILSAKYGPKYMKLLNSSLRSTNLPAYVVAAFIKRLAQAALILPAPRVPFCLAQITWLLRQHRPCQVLLHRSVKNTDANQQTSDFNNNEDVEIESTGALQSSLWEIEVLEKHYIHEIAQLATNLRDPNSTSVGTPAIYVEQYINKSFLDMIDGNLGLGTGEKKQKKRDAALAYKKPNSLFGESFVMQHLFG